ncbi:MAG: glycosyltransferase N-terminal domain-containing protein [Candidatus Neomarinimicrobiota bacterium]
MKIFWFMIYNFLFYPILFTAGLIGTLFNKKIRDGVKGRFQSKKELNQFIKGIDRNRSTYWFHTASHGEYEQVRPVIKGLKEIEPASLVVVSFFSPSGFKNVRDENIDFAFYLPFDFYWSVKKTLKAIDPKKIIFASYDTWPNLIWASGKLNIHTNIFAARFDHNTKKLVPIIRSFYRSVYDEFSTIYTVTNTDYKQLKKIVTPEKTPLIRVLGNPRYDQVKSRADGFTKDRTISVLMREKRMVVGSVWPEDERVIFEPIIKLLKEDEEASLLWVPHEPSEKYVSSSLNLFKSEGFESAILSNNKKLRFTNARVHIVSVIGILPRLYWHGQVAFIGGGFSSGVHNVMEPAIARLPVMFGPRYSKSHEAEELVLAGGGFSVQNSTDTYEILKKLLFDKNFFLSSSLAATKVIHDNLGSATRVVRGIIRD